MKKMKMLRKALCALLAVCLLAAALPLGAFAIEIDYVTAAVGGGFIRVNQYTGVLKDVGGELSGAITIPDTVEGVKVTSIGKDAFYGCEKITSLYIPGSVTTIGDNAFTYCDALQSVTLAEGVCTLGKSAFQYCYHLSSVSLPSTLQSIEEYTFNQCISLTSVTVPSGVDKIGAYAFEYCQKMTSISLPSTLVSLGEYCFSNCTALTSISLPTGLYSVPTALFNNCTSLEQVIVPSGVSRISELAFRGCKSLKRLSLPDSVNSIDGKAFEGCSDDLTFYVSSGSYAQAFASANKIPFVTGSIPDTDSDGDNLNYPSTPFTDDKDHWGQKYIAWAYAMGYIAGTSATTVSPDAKISRGQVATILYRMEGSPAVGVSSFTDLTSSTSQYYKDGIAWAESTKVVSGIGGGKFGPDQNVTREQLACMLYNYAKYKGKNTSTTDDMTQFSDASQVSSWAGTAVSWAVGSGIISGKTGGILDPGGTASRAEAMVMLQKFSVL